ACPACDGLGVEQYFDPQRVIRDPTFSVAGGAVRGWDRRNSYYFQMISSLARHFHFDPEVPFESLPEAIRQLLLYGSGKETIEFTYAGGEKGEQQRRHAFEGIIPNMQRRYRETESNLVREELAKYLSTQPCLGCGGTRLNEAARNVFVADRPLPQVTA